ncbi:MAG: FliO/MopB family protein [Rhodospirillaceae bacterium]
MDFATYFKAFLGLAIVLGLIVGLSWLLKRIGFGDALRGPLGRKRRLATVEAVMLDSRHKAVLIRRDDVEHLVLVGPNTSQVIEHGIPAPAPSPPATPTDTPPSDATPATRFSQWIRP